MSNVIQISAIESALVQGDLSKLNPDQRLSYYKQVCESVGLNMLTRPFDYLQLNGKLVLYAKKDATDQLRKIHGVSVTKLETQMLGDICVVTAIGRDKTGKEDSEVGAVDVKGLAGEKLANAMMKASTKAKRRLTLSMCGLGLLDESEIESIPDAKVVMPAGNVTVAPALQLAGETPKANDPGAYVITFGKKFKDKRLDTCDMYELDSFANYLVDSAQKKGQPLDGVAKEAVDAIDAYLKTREF